MTISTEPQAQINARTTIARYGMITTITVAAINKFGAIVTTALNTVVELLG